MGRVLQPDLPDLKKKDETSESGTTNTSQTPAAARKVFNYIEEKLRRDTAAPTVTPTAGSGETNTDTGSGETNTNTGSGETNTDTGSGETSGSGTSTSPEPSQEPKDLRDAADDLKDKVDDALKALTNLMNTGFVYNERSSPIYSILREEYQKQADRAAAQAYARSVANAGGYGSSYATLAAEEASRAVMDGWDGMQYDLYNAALKQFENEKASAAEIYKVYKGLLEEAEKEAAAETAEAEAEAAAEAEALEQEQLLLEEKQKERETIILNAYGATSESWAETGGANEATIRSMIRNSLPAGTENPQEIVDEVIRRLKSDTAAAQSDAFREFQSAPTLATAQAIYDSAKRSGSLAEYESEMSTSLMTLAINAMGGDADAAAALGLDTTAFSEMDEDGRAEATLDVMSQMKKSGLIKAGDFVEFLRTDMGEDLSGLTAYDDAKKCFGAATKNALAIMELYKKKCLTDEEYEELMEFINEKTKVYEIFYKENDTRVFFPPKTGNIWKDSFAGFVSFGSDSEEEDEAYDELVRIHEKNK